MADYYASAHRHEEALKLRVEALKLREEALAVSLKSADSQASAEAYAELGFALDAVGRGDEAIKAWQEAVRLSRSKFQNTHYWLGKALMDRHRYAEALPILRATLKFYPEGQRHHETVERIALAESKVPLNPQPSSSKK